MNHGRNGRSRNRHYKFHIPVYPCVIRKMTSEERSDLNKVVERKKKLQTNGIRVCISK